VPNIYDNITDDTRLGLALRDSLTDFDTVDVATGYIDLRGWSTMADILDSKPASSGSRATARVLVGMVAPSDSQQLLDILQDQVQPPEYGADIHDRERALARRDQLVAHLRNQLMRGLATTEGQATLQTLKRQLREGVVAMKVFTEKPLHGKTYIFHAPNKKHGSRWAYVGSSNLTGAGLHRNLELNIDVQDSDATNKLATWFDERWTDRFSLDITAEIIDLIEQSWADESQPTPFEVYLKVCHSLSQDARDGMGYVLPKSMSDLLLDYQESAVRTLSRRIVRRGGTMLGDVVGLGKTLTAVATALMLQAAEDYSTLVLCPKNLQPMWEQHLEEYDINGRVISYSMADKVRPSSNDSTSSSATSPTTSATTPPSPTTPSTSTSAPTARRSCCSPPPRTTSPSPTSPTRSGCTSTRTTTWASSPPRPSAKTPLWPGRSTERSTPSPRSASPKSPRTGNA